MKKYFLAIAIIALSFVSAFSADQYKIDAKKSMIYWDAKKVVGGHNGTVNFAGGVLNFEAGKLVSGEFSSNMTTITSVDLKDDAATLAKLVGHLKSDDFFSVDKFKESKFVIKSVAPIAGAKKGEPNYTITGDMTIKGITNSITFPAIVSIAGSKVFAEAKFKIDRIKWNIKYGSGNFFQNLGDKAINDEVDFKIVIFANK